VTEKQSDNLSKFARVYELFQVIDQDRLQSSKDFEGKSGTSKLRGSWDSLSKSRFSLNYHRKSKRMRFSAFFFDGFCDSSFDGGWTEILGERRTSKQLRRKIEFWQASQKMSGG
jgi:hypothetical protein